jgi:hypothetical protein
MVPSWGRAACCAIKKLLPESSKPRTLFSPIVNVSVAAKTVLDCNVDNVTKRTIVTVTIVLRNMDDGDFESTGSPLM